MQPYSDDVHADEAREVSATSYPDTLMSTRLNDADRRAVDALLEGAAASPSEGERSELQQAQRMAAARRWLELMGAMPAEEPSSSLLGTTIARVENTPRGDVSSAAASVVTRL